MRRLVDGRFAVGWHSVPRGAAACVFGRSGHRVADRHADFPTTSGPGIPSPGGGRHDESSRAVNAPPLSNTGWLVDGALLANRQVHGQCKMVTGAASGSAMRRKAVSTSVRCRLTGCSSVHPVSTSMASIASPLRCCVNVAKTAGYQPDLG